MDELAPGDQVASHPISKHLDRELDEATDWLLYNAPLYLLPKEKYEPTSEQLIKDTASKESFILVPPLFARIAYIKFSDWEQPVYRLITEENPDYQIQLNPFTQAGKAKPVVAYAYMQPPTITGYSNWLICYSAEGTPDPVFFIKKQKAEALDDKLVEPIAWLTAARLFQIFGFADKAQLAVAQYNNFIVSRTL